MYQQLIFLQLLTYALEENEPLLVATRSEKEGVTSERNEMNMQDLAFQESLRIDREKEDQRKMEERYLQEERERILKEKQEFEQQKEEVKRNKEEQKKLELQLKEQREHKKELLLSEIPLEPEKGENVISLMIRFHNGKKITRRFHMDDPIKYLFMFVETQVEIDRFELGINFPKKTNI